VTAQYLLSAETSFSAAHTLPGVEKCERMHGHNWRVRLTVQVAADALDDGGMALDFRTIEGAVRTAVADFDHAYLNDLEPFREGPPTAEQVAVVVCRRVTQQLAETAPTARVDAVELWETPQYRVEYRPA
jgi:6-pyruvoyltetrahydropterin/6-carboxytetrahydropterin synthase